LTCLEQNLTLVDGKTHYPAIKIDELKLNVILREDQPHE